MAVILPHHFKDGVGEVASGVQVLENDEALKVAIEALENAAVANYGAFAAKPAGVAQKPSATRSTAVLLTILGGSAGGGATITLPGGATITVPTVGKASGPQTASLSFVCPPEGSWTWGEYGGSPASEVQAAYALLAIG